MVAQETVFVQMALKAWNGQVKNADKFFAATPDADMTKEVAPGKNTASYLLGHLIAVNDGMIALFGLGNREYSDYDFPFVKTPDKSGISFPDIAALRTAWKQSNETLAAFFASMTPTQWMEKHTAMSDQDWINDPARNKLSVLLSRTNHLAYHLGQLVLVK